MAGIIEKQHIAKRVSYSSSSRQTASQRQKQSSFKPTLKSAGIYTGLNVRFMEQFEQKPVRSRKKNPFLRFASFAHFLKSNAGHRDKQEKRHNNTIRTGGFSFPVPSLFTLAVAAGTVVIALAAFNWEDINIKMPEKYVYKPDTETDVERLTMQYAATGITGILPVQISVIETPFPVTETVAAPNAESHGHNDLIIFEWQQYKVKRGDSVSSIAKKFNVSMGAIIASNEIRNARTLQEGAILKIPNIDGIPYQIKKGDSLTKISSSFNVPLEVILDVNDIKSDNIKTGETIFIPGARMNDIDLKLSLGELFIYPLQNKFITSHYGMRKDPINGALNFHTGIDLRANTGTTVIAAMDGVVSVVAENWLYGKHIIITHDNGYKTLYGHLNSYSVKQGDKVAGGKKIGESGNTGYSTGPHLHFSIYDRNNKLVNPLELLR
ncbi:MAG: M23 family metallopeptidase [Spirochaetes bacterium]|nr:M23 family metallopeptidase [Spirochaetota bacterium]